MIGRSKEAAELNRLYNSRKAEFVAIYGRRRIGKTYLVDQVFKNKITFRHAGISPADDGEKNSLNRQLEHFSLSLQIQGMKKISRPQSWLEAFFLLEKYLQDIDDGSRQVVFIDELPWLDTPKSGFVSAFEAFWNTWGCHRDNLMVIVCGSANSWMVNTLINNHGGLYGRLTHEIKLYPFNLSECEAYLKDSGITYSRYDIAQCYMILGGIPYYYSFFRPDYSVAQNIDMLFFSKQAKLKGEYRRLFKSVFRNPDYLMDLTTHLAVKRSGFTRKELLEELKLKDGSVFKDALDALMASDFVEKYVPFGKGSRETVYKLTDPFCLFYLHFINDKTGLDEDFWQNNLNSQSINVWRGFAFENVCFNHIKQIKRALEIGGVSSKQSAWISPGDGKQTGTQIDLIIERRDNVFNMCEIKFYNKSFSVSKSYYEKVLGRIELLGEMIPSNATVHSTLITTSGLTRNEYSGAFVKVITLDDLFCRE